MFEKGSDCTQSLFSIVFCKNSAIHILIIQGIIVKYIKSIFNNIKEKYIFLENLNFLAFTWDINSPLSTAVHKFALLGGGTIFFFPANPCVN